MKVKTKPVNILHVCARWKGGGIKTFVKSILALNNLSDTVHDLLLIFHDTGGIPPYNIRLHQLGFDGTNAVTAMRTSHALFKTYDAVMIHAAHPVAVLPLIKSRMPCLLFQHGMSVSSGSGTKRLIKKTWFNLITRLLNTRIVCSTDHAYQKTRRLGIRLPKNRTLVIPFGTVLQSTRIPRSTGFSSNTIRIGMAGHLVPQKRHDLALQSLQRYDGQHTLHVLIAGDGPEECGLKTLAESIRSEKVHITFLGFVEDMERFYDVLDLVLFPSRDESFGLVVVEAFNHAVPVAVFEDVGGCLPLIHHAENGFIIDNGVQGLETLWNRLDARPEILEELSKYISTMDLSRYDIAYTRLELEQLVMAFQFQKQS